MSRNPFGMRQGDAAQADSLTPIDELGEQVGALGDLIVQGRWSAAWDEVVTALTSSTLDLMPALLRALFVGAIFYVFFRIAYRFVETILKRSRRASAGLVDLVLNSLRVAGLAFVGVIVLSQLGLNVAAAVAGLGIAGLALGFAAKDTLENFISGVTIILDSPFKVGDTVEVGGRYGKVSRFTLRSTRIRTLDRRIVVMPNVSMINQQLINHSALVPIRIEIPFGIAYKESIDAARDTVLAAVNRDDERFDASFEPTVVVTQMNESSVDMSLWLFVSDAADEVPLKLEYTEAIRKALGEADIEIPFPHLQLFIDGAAGLSGFTLAKTSQASGQSDAETKRGA